MDVQKVVEVIENEIAKFVIGIIVLPILIFFRNLPKRIIHEFRAKRTREGLMKGSLINNILSALSDGTGTIYVHIIKYHNNGPQKMTVHWEETGHVCANCSLECVNKYAIKRVQEQWQSQPVSKIWLPVPMHTLERGGKVNTVDNMILDNTHKQIWADVGIELYKEILIKYKSDGFYVLSLSFCKRFDGLEMDGKIFTAARRLEKYL